MSVLIDYTKQSAGLYTGLRSIYSDYSTQSVTGTTNETTLKTYTVPAGHGLGAGCRIIVNIIAKAGANNANAKTFRVKIGGTSIASPSLASTLTLQRVADLRLISTSSQFIFSPGSTNTYSTSTSDVTSYTIDLSGSFAISTTGQLGDGSDTLSDLAMDVSFWYPPA